MLGCEVDHPESTKKKRTVNTPQNLEDPQEASPSKRNSFYEKFRTLNQGQSPIHVTTILKGTRTQAFKVHRVRQ